ncbi:hypothetical protein [Streptomyces rubradiris]|uniref:Uncharacterized protein n=1 Tax=Streptomyces rubradiris TaxID=285531 RepID=A0ABQ3RAF6_STRRR|nr:hypothetical protein [Streptomyces rubradiris]GHH25914.1 hypothetical protein GCM10018792_65670 [Streptomyces rubradiris]GHI52772.1 hypothetical protein Srubr_26180 [Streptomyces rubradiris]
MTSIERALERATLWADLAILSGPDMPDEHREAFRTELIAELVGHPKEQFPERHCAFIRDNCMKPHVRPFFETYLMIGIGAEYAGEDAGPAELSARLQEHFGPVVGERMAQCVLWAQAQMMSPDAFTP